MSVKEWPKNERPYERLRALGAEQLSDGELLAILLNSGDAKRGLSALDLSRELLKKGGSLTGVQRLGFAEISALGGLGFVKCCRIKAAFEIANRLHPLDAFEQPKLGSSKAIAALLYHQFARQKREHFVVVLLDNQNRLIQKRTLSVGSTSSVHIHPREVFHLAIREQASAIVVVHNHPGGDPTPSKEDKKLTVTLTCIGELLGIPLLDHIILGSSHNNYYSFADSFRLKKE